MGLRSRHYRVLISTLPLTVRIKYDSSDKTLRITLDTNKISFFSAYLNILRYGLFSQ